MLQGHLVLSNVSLIKAYCSAMHFAPTAHKLGSLCYRDWQAYKLGHLSQLLCCRLQKVLHLRGQLGYNAVEQESQNDQPLERRF